MKEKVTGTSSKDVVNDVGNPMLHERHRVVLEKDDGEVVSRARVTDQLMIDKLLITGLITDMEHKAAEYLLQVMVDAGAFVRGIDLESAPSASGRFKRNTFTHSLLKLRDICNLLEEIVGEESTGIIIQCVATDNRPPPEHLGMFRMGLQAIDKDYINIRSDD